MHERDKVERKNKIPRFIRPARRALMFGALSLAPLISTGNSTKYELSTAKNASPPIYYGSSSTWSGYVTQNKHNFKAVDGRIKVPKVDCKKPGSNAAFWVGYTYGNSVEQTGVSASCSYPPGTSKGKISGPRPSLSGHNVFHSKPSYYAWWMMFAAGGGGVDPLKIKSGDLVDYKVSYRDLGKYAMSVRDLTTHKGYSITRVCKPVMINIVNNQPVMSSCDPTTVEWIAERAGAASLADFGRITMQDNNATDSGGNIYPLTHYETQNDTNSRFFLGLNMKEHGLSLAKVSNPAPKGDFKVTWQAAGIPGGW